MALNQNIIELNSSFFFKNQMNGLVNYSEKIYNSALKNIYIYTRKMVFFLILLSIDAGVEKTLNYNYEKKKE